MSEKEYETNVLAKNSKLSLHSRHKIIVATAENYMKLWNSQEVLLESGLSGINNFNVDDLHESSFNKSVRNIYSRKNTIIYVPKNFAYFHINYLQRNYKTNKNNKHIKITIWQWLET